VSAPIKQIFMLPELPEFVEEGHDVKHNDNVITDKTNTTVFFNNFLLIVFINAPSIIYLHYALNSVFYKALFFYAMLFKRRATIVRYFYFTLVARNTFTFLD